ncbi:hypothetical protein [Caulobacter endophyticus]|uniref:Uncharacterized protein n=1 Tax=Caulobacter endophyticus TaxID=2172652 RepID=A0A2T9JI62_9CAUL|nr:hypothetical protein [Caulobacter endophyticus]PVM83380.1 hypothetical protein DDF67_20790 [Caulobacter endophyticus]
MTRAAHALFEAEIVRLTEHLGGRTDHARFVFDDLAAEAGHASRIHGAPFCLALRSAITAFELDFVHSRDAAIAHTAACARLEVLALLSRGGK